VEAVGLGRFRDCISLANANYGTALASGDLIQIFPTKLCISFGSTADFSARPRSLLEPSSIASRETPAVPLLRSPTGDRVQQPSV
jgi:hypothetical protein